MLEVAVTAAGTTRVFWAAPRRSSVCLVWEQGLGQPPAPQQPLHSSDLLQDKH